MTAAARSFLALAVALVLGCALAFVAVPPAGATVSRLCLTYSGCAKLGMGSDGYAQASRTMYWRMYSGHNCTNYVAYRMIRSGMPNTRPWSGSGNATNWGTAMASITDSTPRVGAVAWWRAGVYPAGSAGHVAYVEEVVSPDEIIVSQDSWGGEFSWARITRTSKGWPSGFIHFNDVALTLETRPTVTGSAKVGSVLSATPGTWSVDDVTTAYQRQVAGRNVAGATGPTFTVRKADEGKRVRVRVVASATGLPSVTAYSLRTPAVEVSTLTSTTAPSISGDPVVGGELTADPGTWDPAPSSVVYQWLAAGKPVAGADDQSFVPTAAQVGKTLSVAVTVRRAGFEPASATSAPTAAVAAGAVEVVTAPTLAEQVRDGRPRPGEALTLDVGSATDGATATVAWFRDGERVAGRTGRRYVLADSDIGALVTARVSWARTGYRPAVVEATTPRRVKTPPTMTVSTRSGRGWLVVSLDVAAGDEPVRGLLRVRHAGRLLGQKRLVDGHAQLRLTGLAPGTHTYRVIYPGIISVERGVAPRRVRVR